MEDEDYEIETDVEVVRQEDQDPPRAELSCPETASSSRERKSDEDPAVIVGSDRQVRIRIPHGGNALSAFSQADIIDVVQRDHGMRPLICKDLSCSYLELAQVIEKYPRVRRACLMARTQLQDVAEVCLLDLLGSRRDEVRLNAAKLVLKNLGEDGQWVKAAGAQLMQSISVQSDEEKKVAVQNLFGLGG